MIKYRGTRGKVEILADRLSVLFNIRSSQALLQIRKGLGHWIPTLTKFHWETASSKDMHVPTRGMFKDTFKYDGEYALNLKLEALPEVLKAIGHRRATPDELAHMAQMRLKRAKIL